MKTISKLSLIFFLLASVIGVPSRAAQSAPAYIEPGLASADTAPVSVIVTGIGSPSAAQAVASVGGVVTSDLWLIKGVAASVAPNKIEALAASDGVQSIVRNEGIQVAADPGPGWVTDGREKKKLASLNDSSALPVTLLADGGLLAVTKKGVTVLNGDLSQRYQVTLAGSPYAKLGSTYENYGSPVVIGADGTVYIAGYVPANVTATKGWHVYALNPANGATKWTFSAGDVLTFVGLTLGPDGTVYAAAGQNLLAINAATGKQIWKYTITTVGGFKPGLILASPVATPDGYIYVSSAGESVPTSTGTIKPRGHLYALKPSDGYVSGTWKTSMMLKWAFVGDDDNSFIFDPRVLNSTVLVASKKAIVYSLNRTSGALVFRYAAGDGDLKAQPLVASDGRMFLVQDHSGLIGVDPAGNVTFQFNPTYTDLDGQVKDVSFNTAPVLSADGRTLYVAMDGPIFFAVDAGNGAELWRHTMLGNIKTSAGLGADGLVYVGSDAKDLAVLTPAGDVLSSLTFDSSFNWSPQQLTSGQMLVPAGDKKLYTLGPLPSSFDGRPDAESIDKNWYLSNPVSIDVGADQLNDQGITGKGVTVAVVDSGVFVSDKVSQILGMKLDTQFVGQADYVNPNCQVKGQNTGHILHDSSGNGYCWADHNTAVDPFGHGSHVAGIIWSNINDWATGASMGIAPDARILSVRAMDANGIGTYESVVKGIQYVVANRDTYNIRVLNLSLSATPSTPYFVDPINQAVEAAWANGIVVVAAAGNSGPAAETITVPGNDPYVITVGSINEQRTPGYWADDVLSGYSATGPTGDGFVKPDVLAPGSSIISFMYNDGKTGSDSRSSALVSAHPSYSKTTSLFRMSGTSMATAIVSGVVALMLQAHPELAPDQVKYRLMYSANTAVTDQNEPIYNLLQQGAGRIWAPDAVLGTFLDGGASNQGMDIGADLAHNNYADPSDNTYHYQGPVQRLLSEDGQGYLYYLLDDPQDGALALGVSGSTDKSWIEYNALIQSGLTWTGGMSWTGGKSRTGGMSWTGGKSRTGGLSWTGGMSWTGGKSRTGGMSWTGGKSRTGGLSWTGGISWTADTSWTAGITTSASTISTTTWVNGP